MFNRYFLVSPKMIEFSMINYNLNDKNLDDLSKFCTNLQSITIHNCLKVTNMGLGKLSKCLQLQYIDLTGCEKITDEGLEKLLEFDTKLHTIILKRINKITNNGIKIILSKCANSLRNLDLCRCNNTTDSITSRILIECPKLESLNLSLCQQITDTTFVTLNMFPFSNLKKINLQKLNITDCTIFSITEICNGNLELININDCSEITEKGINHLIKSNSNLIEINAGRTNMTDDCLSHIAEYSNRLETLDIDFCENVTINGIYKLIKTESKCWFSLRRLNICGLHYTENELNIVNQNKSKNTFVKMTKVL